MNFLSNLIFFEKEVKQVILFLELMYWHKLNFFTWQKETVHLFKILIDSYKKKTW